MMNIWGINPQLLDAPQQQPTHLQRQNDRSPPKGNRPSNIYSRDPNYIPVSSIPDGRTPGLNYTFVSGELKKKQKKPSLVEETDQPEAPVRQRRKYYPRPSHHTTPDSLKSSNDAIATLDTRVDSTRELADRDLDKKSFLNEGNSYIYQGKLSRGLLQTGDDEETGSEEEEFMKNASPGPGAYNIEAGMLNKKKTYSLFISRASRFQSTRLKQVSPEQSPNSRIPRKDMKIHDKLRPVRYRKYLPFDSSQPRIVEEKPNEVPAPGHYRPRQSIQQDLIKKIQRDFKGKFGVEQPRFKPSKTDNLGPGYYTIDYVKDQQPERSANFKSLCKRQLYKKPPRVPGVGAYQVNPVQVKIYEQIPKDIQFGTKAKRFSNLPLISQSIPIDSLQTMFPPLESSSLQQFYDRKVAQISRKAPVTTNHRSKYGEQVLQKIPGPGTYNLA